MFIHKDCFCIHTLGMFAQRLAREIKSLIGKPPANILLVSENCDDISSLSVRLKGASDTLYADEIFYLDFRFSGSYPLDAPQVTFNTWNVPVHPHIYSNGHICLSILYDEWSPILGIETICLSILSMLSSAQENVRPHDDVQYLRAGNNRNPQETRWDFHDDC